MTVQSIREWIKKEANFFRVHLVFFLLVPLISAGIFWGANGRYPVAFIDALFLCYSALTVTGLSTVNLSTLTVFQQAILFFLMGIGNVTVVAWVMVLIRKRYFVEHLENLHRQKQRTTKVRDRIKRLVRWRDHGVAPLRHEAQHNVDTTAAPSTIGYNEKERIHASEGIAAALVGGPSFGLGLGIALNPSTSGQAELPSLDKEDAARQPSSEELDIHVESPDSASHSYEWVDREDERPAVIATHSITSSPRSVMSPLQILSPTSPRTAHSPYYAAFNPTGQVRRRQGVPVPRKQTVIMPPKMPDYSDHLGQRGKDQGLGGFPGPLQLSAKIARNYFPSVYRFIHRLITERIDEAKKSTNKLTEQFSNLVVYRNSDFNTDELDDDQLEELGGLEYRALTLLSYLVFIYFVVIQLITILLIAPWLSTSESYDEVFTSQPRLVNKTWYTAFQVMGAYTGGGMSLVDAGMVPFQKAYLMIFSLIFAILAGNHGLPILQCYSLRFIIWTMTKFVKDDSTADQTLHFLLDHPRRCFLYLFPSHVTWFLLTTLVFFTSIEWILFIVLDLGLEVTESLPPGTRAVAGLFQSFAVRASGFGIVNLSALAPAFQFLCIVMMYIAVYPVALSIRSTNVYEEKSLGVFALPSEDEDEEPNLDEKTSRRERIGQYFGWHLRRQVAYDIWWLVCGIFFICIIERTKIMDDANAPWFNLFRIVFELVSAFGGIGLSLGIPTENFAFSGAFRPLSKLVVIVIMLRGRNRGLPVAIDRAILLPEDVVPHKREGDPSVKSPIYDVPPTSVMADPSDNTAP